MEPATGDFVFGVSEGYLIENGEVTAPVRGATLIGNGIEALPAIDAIAGDLAMKSGFCGKDGQQVPVGTGPADTCGSELTVGGTDVVTLDDVARLAVDAALDAGRDEADAWARTPSSARPRLRRGGREPHRGGRAAWACACSAGARSGTPMART